MKKKFNLFMILLLFFTVSKVFADCYTGFACSIADLEQKEKEQLIKDIAVFKKYLENRNSLNSYNNLFLFNSIL